MWREAFRRCTSPELFISADQINRLVAEVGSSDADVSAPPLATTLAEVEIWSGRRSADYAAIANPSTEAARLLTHAVLRQSAPFASSLGAWLQGMSAPGVFEDDAYLKVLALFADDIGVGHAQSSRYDEFTSLAKYHRRSELAVAASELAAQHSIRDHMFALPTALLAMTRRSDQFAPMIVGIDVVMRTVGLLPCWAWLRPAGEIQHEWAKLDLSLPTGAAGLSSSPLTVSTAVARGFCATDPELERQVRSGAMWMFDALKRWDEQVFDLAAIATDPHRAMEQLLQERAREGAVYHQEFLLGGHSLSELLDRAKTDPSPLLKELASSRVIKPGDASRSALVKGLIGPRGPMFRVFSSEDVQIISRWIESLPDLQDASTPQPPVAIPKPPEMTHFDTVTDEEQGVAPRDIREAYFVLQGRALAPETRKFAVDYVDRWLAKAKVSVGRTDRSLPDTWTPIGLRPWLLQMHDRHSIEFESGKSSALPTREEVIDSTLQLAPLTLIDGSWLQGFTDVSLATKTVGFPLFETYWDELGNGQIALNHPKIYRDVLREMGIELPPTGTREFADDSRFREESLRRPVYWLCLGKMPHTYLPEILGMNLAMELSGVGGSYRTARTFLKHYEFSTHFVDLHNTIDNVSTGHSAWAADAIDTHMRAVADSTTSNASEVEWQRIRTGYESLAPLPSRLADLKSLRLPNTIWKPRRHGRPLFHHTPVGVV